LSIEMPKIVGKSVRVVDFEGLSIDELCGNVATKDDTISIAHVRISNACGEPWLTLHYDEWICVTKGSISLHFMENDEEKVLTAQAGETVFVGKGERFRPVFSEAGTEYFPVCLPAFRPDRCLREEEGVTEVSKNLQNLHRATLGKGNYAKDNDHSDIQKLYHMCQKSLWENTISERKAYFPPTFRKDGMFTHATAVPQRLIETANHFYTSVEGDWICLELSRQALLNLGIDTIFEEAKPVGETGVSNTWDWICPHIYGGIPTSVEGIVTKIYPMKRDQDGNFLSIDGLTQD